MAFLNSRVLTGLALGIGIGAVIARRRTSAPAAGTCC